VADVPSGLSLTPPQETTVACPSIEFAAKGPFPFSQQLFVRRTSGWFRRWIPSRFHPIVLFDLFHTFGRS
jgi:hypothetical protein